MNSSSCIRQQADIDQINRCKEATKEHENSIEYLSRILELVGNSTRLKILCLLKIEKQLCVCDLSDILGMTISSISQHLRKLKDRNFIKMERQAQTIFYSLTSEHEIVLEPIFKLVIANNNLSVG